MIIAAIFSIITVAGLVGSVYAESRSPQAIDWIDADRQLAKAAYPATMRPYLWG